MHLKAIVYSALALFAAHLALGADPLRFLTDKEAVDHYLNEVQKQKPVKTQVFYEIVGLDPKYEKEMLVKLGPMMKMLDVSIKNAGAFRSAKVIKVLKLGPMVSRAQYLVTYEKNMMTLDLWFINATEGWQLVIFKFNIGADAGTSLAKVPAEFQTAAESF